MAKKRKKPNQRQRKKSSPGHPPAKPPRDSDVEVMGLTQYEISNEPIEDPYFENLTPQEREDMDWAGPNLQTKPQRCIDILERLIEKYPDYPKVYNYLAAAYGEVGRSREALELVIETYRRFPKYLFGRVNYAMYCMRQGQIEKVPEIFEHKFALHLLYPERRGHFHLSEFTQFTAVMGIYYVRTGKIEPATDCWKVVNELYPTHPLVTLLTKEMQVQWLKRRFRGKE